MVGSQNFPNRLHGEAALVLVAATTPGHALMRRYEEKLGAWRGLQADRDGFHHPVDTIGGGMIRLLVS